MEQNICAVTVYYYTSLKQKLQLSHEFQRRNIPLFTIDNSSTGLGYAEGINKVLRNKTLQQYDVYIICNPDISLGHITTKQLLEVANHFDIGGYAFKQDGETYYGGQLDRLRMSGGLCNIKPAYRFKTCDFVSGSLMIVKRTVIEKIGLFDESYGMYYEDVDYCIRAHKAGFSVGFDSDVLYEHFETSDSNPKKKLFLVKNRRKILWKYGNWKQKLYEIIRLPKTIKEEGLHF